MSSLAILEDFLNIQLQPFTREQLHLWLAQLEQQLLLHKITDDYII